MRLGESVRVVASLRELKDFAVGEAKLVQNKIGRVASVGKNSDYMVKFPFKTKAENADADGEDSDLWWFEESHLRKESEQLTFVFSGEIRTSAPKKKVMKGALR